MCQMRRSNSVWLHDNKVILILKFDPDKHSFLFVPGQPKQVEPDLFRVFYTVWKETEAEAQDVNLPSEVINHLDNSECVYKLSSCVKTSHGVGKIAMTQKRLFLLTEGQPGFLEITKFRDIQVKCHFCLLSLLCFLDYFLNKSVPHLAAGCEDWLGSFPTRSYSLSSYPHVQQARGVWGQPEDGDWTLEPRGQRDVGWT